MPSSRSGMTCTRTGGPPSAPCENKPPTLRPHPTRGGGATGERPLGQRGPDLSHQVEIEVEVVERCELRTEHLAGKNEVPDRSPAEVPAGVAWTTVLDGARVAGVRGVADHQLAVSGEEGPVPTVAGREDAVEKVISHRREAKQIAGRSEAHQVARPILGEHPHGGGRDARGLGRHLAYRQATHRVAFEAEGRDAGGAL